MNRLAANILSSPCALVAMQFAAAAPPAYVVTDLGSLDGVDSLVEPGSAAWGLAPGAGPAAPVVVGLSVDDVADHDLRGFRTIGGAGLLELGPLAGDVHCTAFAVNAGGESVGVSYVLGALSPHAVRWSPDGVPTSLGDGAARDINAAGTIAGAVPVANSPGVTHAARWSGGAAADLGTLGGPHSVAMAINDAGWVVGESLLSNGTTMRGFVHTGTSMKALPTLGGPRSHGLDIGAAGAGPATPVVGIAWTTGGQPHAVRWTLDGAGNVTQTLDLGLLPGASSSAAYAIAGDLIVGTSNDRAVRWSGAGGGAPTDLNTQIDAGLGWDLRSATGVSAGGHIVGTGRHLGRGRAFLLSPRAATDLDADGDTDGADLGLLLAGWGSSDPALDLDGSGVVDGGDIGLLLAGWTAG